MMSLLPRLQDEPDLLLDEPAEPVYRRLRQILPQQAEDEGGAAEDGLAQLPGLLQLLQQLTTLLCQLLLKYREYYNYLIHYNFIFLH